MGTAEGSCAVMAALEFTPSAHVALSVWENGREVYPVPAPEQKIPSLPAETRLWWFVQGIFHYGLKDLWVEWCLVIAGVGMPRSRSFYPNL